jgi:GT2 family glycosyltransferase
VAVEPNFLEPLIARLNENPAIGAVQPLIYFHHDRHLIWNA